MKEARYLSELSFEKATEAIQESGSVILPISAGEPVLDLPLNTLENITKKVAERVAEITGLYITTPINTGIITPFKPFPDIGLHKNRFRAVISDCVTSLNASGVKKVYFLTSSDNFSPSIIKGIADYKKRLTSDFSFEIISWQSTKYAKETAPTCFENLVQYWRNETSVLLLTNELFKADIPFSQAKLPFSTEDFTKWKKRGLDPDKLRNLSPKYKFCSYDSFTSPDFSFFEGLCQEISKTINKKR